MTTLGQKMAHGAVWMIAANLCARMIGIASIIILARLLVPADFGLVSMAMSVIAMLEVLGSVSFDVALIQNQRAGRKHYDTAWTFNILVGIGSCLAVLLLAGPASRFFREPRLEPVIMFLAVLPLLTGFENIGLVEFRKQLQFNKDFKFLFAKKLASFVVVVPLAVIFRNYWSLVIGVATGRAAGLVLSYALQPYRPRLSLTARHELFHFSKWLYITNISGMLLQRAPDLVIGRIAGLRALGLFNISHEIAFLPTSELVAPINRAAFPGYAKKSSDPALLRQGFLSVWSMICLLMVPAAVGMSLTADYLVPVFLGEKWLDARPLIQLLAVAGLLVALQTNANYVYVALGKPRISATLTVCYVLLLVPILALGTHWRGPIGAAWAYVTTVGILLPLRYAILQRYLGVKTSAMLGGLWRPVTGAGIMAAAVLGLTSLLPPAPTVRTLALQLLLVVGVGAAVYVAGTLGLWRLCGSPAGVESFVLQQVSQKREAWRAWRRTV